MANVYHTYILRSRRTGKYYIGSTEGLHRRIQEHSGLLPALGRFTMSGRPWELVFQAEYSSRRQALAAERHIKKMKSSMWIRKLIVGEYRLPDF